MSTSPQHQLTGVDPVGVVVDACGVRIASDIGPRTEHAVVEDVCQHAVALEGDVVAAADACEAEAMDVIVEHVDAHRTLVEDHPVARPWEREMI